MSRPRPSLQPARRRSTPVAVAVIAAVGVAVFFVAPLAGLMQRAPWSHLVRDLNDGSARTALWLSLKSSLLATILSVGFGIPIAIVTSRRASALTRSLLTLPLVLPPVVGGVALLFAFGRNGLVGQWLFRWFDVQLPFTTAGVVFAEAFVSLPFLVVTVDGALRSLDGSAEAAASTLGANSWYTLSRITLPSVLPSIVAGTLLAWARALGEFGATITFAGSFPGTTQTMPLAVFLKLEGGEPEAAVSMSLVLLALSVGVLVLVGRTQLFGAAAAGLRTNATREQRTLH